MVRRFNTGKAGAKIKFAGLHNAPPGGEKRLCRSAAYTAAKAPYSPCLQPVKRPLKIARNRPQAKEVCPCLALN
jgi:hypothetical protein